MYRDGKQALALTVPAEDASRSAAGVTRLMQLASGTVAMNPYAERKKRLHTDACSPCDALPRSCHYIRSWTMKAGIHVRSGQINEATMMWPFASHLSLGEEGIHDPCDHAKVKHVRTRKDGLPECRNGLHDSRLTSDVVAEEDHGKS